MIFLARCSCWEVTSKLLFPVWISTYMYLFSCVNFHISKYKLFYADTWNTVNTEMQHMKVLEVFLGVKRFKMYCSNTLCEMLEVQYILFWDSYIWVTYLWLVRWSADIIGIWLEGEKTNRGGRGERKTGGNKQGSTAMRTKHTGTTTTNKDNQSDYFSFHFIHIGINRLKESSERLWKKAGEGANLIGCCCCKGNTCGRCGGCRHSGWGSTVHHGYLEGKDHTGSWTRADLKLLTLCTPFLRLRIECW